MQRMLSSLSLNHAACPVTLLSFNMLGSLAVAECPSRLLPAR